MPKPVILSLDDDPSVLNSVERTCARTTGSDYRILSINAGQSGFGLFEEDGTAQRTSRCFWLTRMPEMSGVNFFERSHPDVSAGQRVLLTAYADTQAAIDSITKSRLDYYLMKPWHPPEERLYHIG